MNHTPNPMEAALARTDPQINFRLPAPLLDAVTLAAARNHRTLTAEIVARLEASLSGAPSYSAEHVAELIEAVEARCSKRAAQVATALQLHLSRGASGFSGQQVSEMIDEINAALSASGTQMAVTDVTHREVWDDDEGEATGAPAEPH